MPSEASSVSLQNLDLGYVAAHAGDMHSRQHAQCHRVACKAWKALLFATATVTFSCAHASEPCTPWVQLGESWRTRTQSATVGIVCPWKQTPSWLGAPASGHWEAALGHWRIREHSEAHGRSSATLVSITPVLRWRWADRGAAFVEAGIGLGLIAPIYQAQGRRFSTRFNFADHLALGWQFQPGAGVREVSLRVQHYSNAGIRQPNPGEDFVQIRLVWAFN